MLTLFKKNTNFIYQSRSTVEVKVSVFLCIRGVEGDNVFFNNSTTSHRRICFGKFCCFCFLFLLFRILNRRQIVLEMLVFDLEPRGLLQLTDFPMQSGWLTFFPSWGKPVQLLAESKEPQLLVSRDRGCCQSFCIASFVPIKES